VASEGDVNARAGLAIAAIAGLAVAGCGPVVTKGEPAVTVAPRQLADCPPTTTGEAIPLDAVPTAVLRCDRRTERVPGDGEWTVDVRDRATAGLDRLVATLGLPSERRPTDQVCGADVRLPTGVLLEFGTRMLPVVTPKDACGKTRPEVHDAYEALTWTEVSRTRVVQVRSEAAVAAGCHWWRDEVAIQGPTARPGGPGGVAAPAAGAVRVCRYRSVYPLGWTPDAAGAVVDGRPASGFTASPAQAADLVAALDRAGPAARCTLPHTAFAVVFLGDEQAYVELDGCQRILAPDGTLRRGTHDLAALLATG
jgi:hypothetical protein